MFGWGVFLGNTVFFVMCDEKYRGYCSCKACFLYLCWQKKGISEKYNYGKD